MNDSVRRIATNAVDSLIGYAQQVLAAERDEQAKSNNIICVPRRESPKDAILTECWETSREFVIICGDPQKLGEEHNCDEMGCGSWSHVVARLKKPVKPAC